MASNARSAFQLWARGDSLNGWPFRMHSKAIFARREDAESYIPEFRRRCIDQEFFECAVDNEDLVIKVVEFDFFD